VPNKYRHLEDDGKNRTGNVRLNVTLKLIRANNVAIKKQCVTFSECVSVALGIQHAKRMRHTVFPSVACFVRPYFFTLSFKRQDFRKGGDY